MIGKGAVHKSFNEVEPGKWAWMNHIKPMSMDTEQVLVKIQRRVKSGVVVKLPSGAELEVTNPRALTKAIGEV